MKKILAGALGGAAALLVVFGSGSAFAEDEYAGMTYAEAAENITQYGKAIISSRQGSYLPTDQCIVTGSRKSPFLDSSGNSAGYAQLLDINCNDKTALNGHPGNSAMSPDGKKALQLRQTAKDLSKNYETLTADGKEPGCSKSYGENVFNYCVRICDQSDACSQELLEYLGS